MTMKKGERTPYHLRENATPMAKMLRAARIRMEAVCVEGGFAVGTVRRFIRPGDPNLYNSKIETVLRLSETLGCAPVELLPILGKRPSKKGMLHRAGVIADGRQKTAQPMNLESD